MLIAIPAFRLSCRVGIDKGRAWSIVEELILWAVNRQPMSIAQIAADADLPRQIVVASIARLMRFRLVELTVNSDSAAFRTSEYGRDLITSGKQLPFFPKRLGKRVSFVIEQISGSFFPSGQVRMLSDFALQNDPDPDIRIVRVEGGGPSLSHEANFDRLAQIAARGWEEQLALIDGRTSTVHNEFMAIRVVDGVPRNVPDAASETLRSIIEEAAAYPIGTSEIPVGYAGAVETHDPLPTVHRYSFDPADLIIGGSAQRDCILALIAKAHRRVIIHSTFLDARKFRDLFDEIRQACQRGVSFDLLWGAEAFDDTENRNSKAAVEIAKLVREDRDVSKGFRMHMRTTGSHAKLVLVDTVDGDWIAAVGSCNWLSSPFQAVELTVVLRDHGIVAEVAVALQRMVGRRGLTDEIATEMALVARELRKWPKVEGISEVSMIFGDGHDALMRVASGNAENRIVVGSNRLGSTARPGVVMQGESAVERANVDVTLLYSYPSGPLKKRHARKLAEEALENGVTLVKTDNIPLHGKFVAWDDDHLAVTSLNWASASSDIDFPQADIGVLVSHPGIATFALEKLQAIYPELQLD